MLSGDNGLLTKVGQARDETIVGQEKEQVELAYISAKMKKTGENVTAQNLRDELNLSVGENKTTVTGNETLKVKFEDSKNEYTISKNGTVEKYIPKELNKTNVYAKLYDDGTLILSSTDYTESSKTLTKDFGVVENKSNNNYWSASDYKTLVTKVRFYDEIVPNTTTYYFNNLSNLTSFENMENLETGLVTDMSYMFAWCNKLTSIDLTNFNTKNVKNMNYMFLGCNLLEQIDLSSFDTYEVTSMEGMFKMQSFNNHGVPKILVNTGPKSIIFGTNWNTINVTNMGMMFCGATNLESIDLSKFNTINVTNMFAMFTSCIKLNDIDLSSFDTSNVTNMEQMFWMHTESLYRDDVMDEFRRSYNNNIWEYVEHISSCFY